MGYVSKLFAPDSSVSKRIMVRAITLVKFGGHDFLSARKKVKQTPSIMIVSVVIHFKRKKVFTPMTTHAPAPLIKAHTMVFSLARLTREVAAGLPLKLALKSSWMSLPRWFLVVLHLIFISWQKKKGIS
jgi:hypothetical protein